MSRQPSNQGFTDGSRNLPFRGQGSKQIPRGDNPGGGGDRRGGGGGGHGLQCYRCQGFGHFASDCPKNYGGGRLNSQAPNSGSSQQHGRPYQGAPTQGGSGGAGGSRSQAANFPGLSSQTLKGKIDEDNLLARSKSVKRTAVSMPHRPDYGTSGQQVEILANYFKIVMKDSLVLYSYDIKVTAVLKNKGDKVPEPRGKKLKQIIRIMFKTPNFLQQKRHIVTDFQQRVISLKVLPEAVRNTKVEYYHEADHTARNNAQVYHLNLSPAQEFPELSISSLIEFLSSTKENSQYPAKLAMVQALNILIGHHTIFSPTTTMIGGKRAFPHDTELKDLHYGLEALRGFFSSVRLASFRPLINVNLTHGAFYKTVWLPTLMDEYGVENSYNALEAFLKGLKVFTTYVKDKEDKPITMNRTISGFANVLDGYGQNPPPIIDEYAGSPLQVWFHLKDSAVFAKLTAGNTVNYGGPGSVQRRMLKKEKRQRPNYISVYEFFGAEYNIWSRADERYPVVNLGSRKDPKYVPAEACYVGRGQLSRLKLSSSQTTEMISFAQRKPSTVTNSIKTTGLKVMGLDPVSSQLHGFGVTVDKDMVKVAGRLLSPPGIKYGNSQVSAFDGKWNLRGQEFKTTPDKPSIRWEYLVIKYANTNPNLQPSINLLIQALSNAGIVMDPPKKPNSIEIKGPQDKLLARPFVEAAKRQSAFLLVIIPEKTTILYNYIKQLADVEYGVPTVCVVGAKFEKCKPDYCANLTLKINLKLGGTNHVLCAPRGMSGNRITIISEKKTMVVGIDVTHPGPGSANPSIAAMVASIDDSLAQWPADLRVQIRTRQEMVTLLGDMLRSRLAIWKRHHGLYPENILVYRDGVSESQYEQVLNDEFSLMQKACPALYATTKQQPPRFTIIIVGKRHHTRFFVPDGSPAGDYSTNPKCGLVVDRGVTETRNWDFFLQSHSSHLGTARPSHYYVLWDEIFTNPQSSSDPLRLPAADLLEQVTHDLCYLFGRSTKAVSLCPPVYYADIACDRAARYLGDKSFGSESISGRSESEMTEGERERLRAELQKKITVHKNLDQKMFYI